MFAAVKMMGLFFLHYHKTEIVRFSGAVSAAMLGPNCPLVHTEPITMPSGGI